MQRASLTLPLVLMVIGAIWFLKATDILPATATLIAAGLVVLGVVVLAADGINKQSVISGPLLMYAGAAIYARHTGFLAYSPLLAIGLMVLGGLLLLARSDWVPHKHSRQTPPTHTET